MNFGSLSLSLSPQLLRLMLGLLLMLLMSLETFAAFHLPSIAGRHSSCHHNDSRVSKSSPPSLKSSYSSSSSLSLSLWPIDNLLVEQSTVLIAEEGGSIMNNNNSEWRQYVPLVVSFGVILDILLGSPLANIVLGPMRRAAAKNGSSDNEQDGLSNNSIQGASRFIKNPKERVDSDALAQAALERARYSMELRNFLEANKTNEQRYEEMRKKIEKQAQELDDNLENIFQQQNNK
mmetsp:Transcript_9495/g.17864  ORF Transcript_9495/g.17864 Transcript_9495/m.17864 type:complete len:234 (+) Transcript_9495:139-840(+)